MIAYKGFHPGMVCIGYQFQMGLNMTEEANCRKNGFHCAEDPLDCLSYTVMRITRNTILSTPEATLMRTNLTQRFPALN